MRIDALITEHFIFLLNSGFQIESETYYNIAYNCTFTDINGYKIIIYVDLREEFVDIKIKIPTKVFLAIEGDTVIENHDFNGLKDMLCARENIYVETKKKRRGFSEQHIDAILALYANFIKINFTNITGRAIE